MSHRTNVSRNPHKGPRQTHLNRTKFDPNRYKDSHEQLDKSFLDVMTSLCCRKCCDQIQWKVDYGKYQPLDRPKKCNGCREKKVAIAYHHLCQECSKETAKCAKCQKQFGIIAVEEAKKKKEAALASGTALQEEDDSSVGVDSDDDGGPQVNERGRKITDDHALAKYKFVDEPIEDEDFKYLQGLDVRRLVDHKRKVAAMKEREGRQYLRESERRTVLREEKKKKEGGEDEAADDSDEEI